VDGLSAGAITNGPLWVNATATYALEQAPPYIRAGAKTYYLNMTLVPDANADATTATISKMIKTTLFFLKNFRIVSSTRRCLVN